MEKAYSQVTYLAELVKSCRTAVILLSSGGLTFCTALTERSLRWHLLPSFSLLQHRAALCALHQAQQPTGGGQLRRAAHPAPAALLWRAGGGPHRPRRLPHPLPARRVCGALQAPAAGAGAGCVGPAVVQSPVEAVQGDIGCNALPTTAKMASNHSLTCCCYTCSCYLARHAACPCCPAGPLPPCVSVLDVCRQVLAHFGVDDTQYQIGRTRCVVECLMFRSCCCLAEHAGRARPQWPAAPT